MTRAVAYCRDSTNEQVLGTSLDTQSWAPASTPNGSGAPA